MYDEVDRKQATLYDIAKEAGVAPMTVSRVLSGRGSVSQKTKEKVLKIAKHYNYTTNGVARSLKNAKTNQLLFATPWIKEFFNFEVISAVQATAQKHGYSLILAYTEDSEDGLTRVISQMQSHMVDGLFLMTSDINSALLDRLRVVTRPIVLSVIAPYHGCPLPYDYVGTDTNLGIRMATDYFIHNKHTKIGYIGMSEHTLEGRERLCGFRNAMQDANLDLNPEWIFTGGNNDTFGYRAGLQLANQPYRPSAVVSATDSIAIGIYNAFETCGIQVPNDIAIIGMDNVDLGRYVKPNLASVDISPNRIGEKAIEFLIQRVESGITEIRNVVFTPELIIRDSAVTTASVDSRKMLQNNSPKVFT